MSPLRILITGSREWTDRDAVRVALVDAIGVALADMVVVHGDADGADALAAEEGKRLGCAVEPVAAPWSGPCPGEHRLDPLAGSPWCQPGHRKARRGGRGDYCPRAGHRRNQRMVDLGADVCLAFPLPSSTGTWDCVKRAEAAGIDVRVIGGAS